MFGRKVIYISCINCSYNNVVKGIGLLDKKHFCLYRKIFMQVRAFERYIPLRLFEVLSKPYTILVANMLYANDTYTKSNITQVSYPGLLGHLVLIYLLVLILKAPAKYASENVVYSSCLIYILAYIIGSLKVWIEIRLLLYDRLDSSIGRASTSPTKK